MNRAPEKQFEIAEAQLGTGASSASVERFTISTDPGAIPDTGVDGTAANPIVASELIARLSVSPGNVTLPADVSFWLSTTLTSLSEALKTIVSCLLADTAIMPGEGPALIALAAPARSKSALTISNPGAAVVAETLCDTKARNFNPLGGVGVVDEPPHESSKPSNTIANTLR